MGLLYLCRQGESRLTSLRLLAHRARQVGRRGTSFLVPHPGPTVHGYAVRSVVQDSRRDRSIAFFFSVRTQRGDHESRILSFGVLREFHNLSTFHLVLEDLFDLLGELVNRWIVRSPDRFGIMTLLQEFFRVPLVLPVFIFVLACTVQVVVESEHQNRLLTPPSSAGPKNGNPPVDQACLLHDVPKENPK